MMLRALRKPELLLRLLQVQLLLEHPLSS